MSRLEQDERFTEFRDTPGVFRRAAVNYSDPEGFLEGVREAVSRLEQDERFADLRGTPGVFRMAAVHYSDPEGFLMGVQEAVSRLDRMNASPSSATRPASSARRRSTTPTPRASWRACGRRCPG